MLGQPLYLACSFVPGKIIEGRLFHSSPLFSYPEISSLRRTLYVRSFNRTKQLLLFILDSFTHLGVTYQVGTLLRTHSFKQKTLIEFRNRLILINDSKLFSFNNKWKAAEQLSQITIENAKNPIVSFMIEPPKKTRKRKRKSKLVYQPK
jgi:hypothetical protein